MQRHNIFAKPTAGESLNIPQFNNSLGTLALRNTEVYTNQVDYLETGDVLRLSVGKLKYITMFTYHYSNVGSPTLNTMDDFTILSALDGTNVRSTKYTIPSTYLEDALDNIDPQSSNPDGVLRYQWITYAITPSTTNEVDYYDITIGNFGGSSGSTIPGTNTSQKTFFILHADDYEASYAQLVGDLYQGNEDILGSTRDHFNNSMSAPIIGRQASYFKLSKDLFPTQDAYGLLSTFLGKGISSDLFIQDNILARPQHSDTTEISQYSLSKRDESIKVLGIGSDDTSMYLSLPSRFNIYPLGMTALPSEAFYVGRLLDSSLTYGDKDILTSFEVNLVNESAGLKYYNLNLNRYLSKDDLLRVDNILPIPTFQTCNSVEKNVKIGMFIFSNVAEGGIDITAPGLKINYSKAW